MGVLDEIVSHKRAEVAGRRAARPVSLLESDSRALPPAKDFEGALRPAAGADAVLLIVAAVGAGALRDLFQAAKGVGLGTLVEAHTAREVEEALALGAQVVGINNRDLQTLDTDVATSVALLPMIPAGCVAVSESGIFTREDVERVVAAGAHAVLVGEALVRAGDVAAKVRELTLRDA